MLKCERCGAINPSDHRYCKDCSASLTNTRREADDDTTIIHILEQRGRNVATGEHVALLWLLDLNGVDVDKSFELSDEQVIIGRHEDCAVCLRGNTVSRRHGQLRHADGQYYLSDLGSTNGTLLNGEALVGEEQLHDRDEIGIGIYKLIFRLP